MMELKFDYARFAAGEMPTVTRDGRRVLKVIDSGLDVDRPIAAWIEDGSICPYTRNGCVCDSVASPHDLQHEPRKRTARVLLWYDSDGDLIAQSEDELGIAYEGRRTTLTKAKHLHSELTLEVEDRRGATCNNDSSETK